MIGNGKAGITALLIGDGGRAEFASAVAALGQVAETHIVADLATALQALESGAAEPTLIVVAQSYPGEFPPVALQRLHAATPLAPLVMLLGSWCEGELRSGHPWPGGWRAYWHQWPHRIVPEVQRLATGRLCVLNLPLTATEEDRLLAVNGRTVRREPANTGCPLVAIHTPVEATAEWLAAACRARGFSTVWLRASRPVDDRGVALALFDAWHWDDRACAALRGLADACRPAPVLALADFPRYDDVRRARYLGAAAVLSKPFDLAQLYRQLDAVVPLAGRCAGG